MRIRGRRLLSLGLSLCLLAGSAAAPRITGYAAETETSAKIAQEISPAQESAEDADENQAAQKEGELKSTEKENTASENMEEPEELKENSFRFQDGQPIDRPVFFASEHPNAWGKVNGQYINSVGEPIKGAKKKGIDVSHHQIVNWEKVKKTDVDFALIRCGYGGNYTKYDDRQWLWNVKECERLGIPYGVYLYSYAENTADARSEAEHVLRLLKGHSPAYPVYYDLEDRTTASASNSMIGQIAKTFCDRVAAAGYDVGIYANLDWWKNRLTSSVFNNTSWSKWVAQYNTECKYTKPYDIWQSTSTGKVNGVMTSDGKGNPSNVDINFWMGDIPGSVPDVNVADRNIISTTVYMQAYGWQKAAANGEQAGMTGLSKRLEAFQIKVGSGYGDLGVRYSAHVSNIGWQNPVTTGQTAGKAGGNQSIEAIKIELTGAKAAAYDIYYRVHSQDYGWLGWAKNGAPAGTTGYNKKVEAFQTAVVPKGAAAPGSISGAYKENPKVQSISYAAHVQDYGWQKASADGAVSGTIGKDKHLEALKINILYPKYSGGIEYKTHVADYGWLGWAKNGAVGGTTGKNKQMEAIQIRLTGQMAEKYDIYYSVHAADYGWLGWAKNGENAGTIGLGKQMEAIRIRLVEKGQAAPGSTENKCLEKTLSYQAHVADYGWMGTTANGNTAGTTGKNKQMEAIKISLYDQKYAGGITYKAHVADYGWLGWTKNGAIGGTTGKNKQMEAIQIKLTGQMAEKYDVYYRVHSQSYGWLGWAKNGENAGTTGLNKHMEAIQIRLVAKGQAAPGSTAGAYKEK